VKRYELRFDEYCFAAAVSRTVDTTPDLVRLAESEKSGCRASSTGKAGTDVIVCGQKARRSISLQHTVDSVESRSAVRSQRFESPLIHPAHQPRVSNYPPNHP
jgi:hypothetical protein